MDAAALDARQSQERTRKRGGNGQHGQDMAARQLRRAVAPLFGLPIAFLTPPTWKRIVGIGPGKDMKDAARS